MWLRGLTTSAIISLLATFLVFNFPQFFLSFGPMFLVLLISTLISSMAIVYGRQITRRLKREKGAIKWFDPSKGYGFVEK
jgi:threonine/homoserine/homoserine lactone efflux protein